MAAAQNRKLSVLHKAAKVGLGDARAQLVALLSTALADHHGNVTHTARAFGIGRQTMIRYMIAYPELRDFANDQRTTYAQEIVGGEAVQDDATDGEPFVEE